MKWVALLVLASGLMVSPAMAAGDRSCDRGCLEGLVGRYLTALAAHDPAKLPAARGLRFVENDQDLKLGQGTWASVDGLGTYRHIFADPEAGQVAAIAVVKEYGSPAILDIRLKVENRKITEAESQIIRDPIGAGRYEALGAPPPEWLQAVPAAERLPRGQLIADANKYFTGMQRNDPKGDYSFFDPDCNRLEHAQQTTNVKAVQPYGHVADVDFASMTCQQQFQTGFLGFVTELRNRRFVVVDEERQAVFAFVDLDHNGTVRVLHLGNGKDQVIPPYFGTPRTLQVGEAFKIRNDKLWRIEMTLTELPYGMRPAFDVPPAPARPKEPPSRNCDRDCLTDTLAQVLQAIADHRPEEAPLAPNVRYTENGQVLKPGDGLWGTTTAIAMPGDGLSALGPAGSSYKLPVIDVPAGLAACLCSTNENGNPGIMAIRIKVAGGKVSEIEAVAVRQESRGPTGGTLTLFRTPILADFSPKAFTEPDAAFLTSLAEAQKNARSSIAAAVNRYFDGVAYSARDGAVTKEGATRLNGQAQAGLLPAAEVRGRRILAVDEDRGLALAVAMLDHDGRQAQPAGGGAPWPPATNFVAAVFKVSGGRIGAVEAIERPVPFGMTSGWDDR